MWTTRDWDRKVAVFSAFFDSLKRRSLLANASKSLCIGARVGQEVAALKRVGVSDSVGIDLVPYPPLVLKGDFHRQPFADGTFDFEFSNVFDHALYPRRFIGEIERTLRPGGICVLHVLVSKRADKCQNDWAQLVTHQEVTRIFGMAKRHISCSGCHISKMVTGM
ncbi:S-adenosyl-L-methionine-dependent methyltransferases superfamily protein [Striga hermonthica]|uniref:S-adenosyl-L-methionine-dependent methyltransferases superfamily protein n=1 Tax=Striga hermonthica TaxID=68872 RepID=A0A9N7NG04_STRHE|nr:S-adenosyl-L-methionine-dependent methyltransferases superfamily protein [Striga hermonthica]